MTRLQDLAELEQLAVKAHVEREDREEKLLSEGGRDTFVRSLPPPPDYADVMTKFRTRVAMCVLFYENVERTRKKNSACEIEFWPKVVFAPQDDAECNKTSARGCPRRVQGCRR